MRRVEVLELDIRQRTIVRGELQRIEDAGNMKGRECNAFEFGREYGPR